MNRAIFSSRGAIVALVAIAAGGAIALVLTFGGGGEDAPTAFAEGAVPPRKIRALEPAARAAGCDVRSFRSEGSLITVLGARYRSNPPHSGNHGPVPVDMAKAYYDDPPPTEAVVHSLRHGRIAIWFRPGVAEALKGDLKALFEEDEAHMLLLGRPSLPVPVAASAWRHTLTCPRVTPEIFDALRAFRDEYRDRGPEFVP